jgi:hypothetical protein
MTQISDLYDFRRMPRDEDRQRLDEKVQEGLLCKQ